MYLDGGGDGVEISFGSGTGDRVEDSCGHEGSVKKAWVWVRHCRLNVWLLVDGNAISEEERRERQREVSLCLRGRGEEIKSRLSRRDWMHYEKLAGSRKG